MENQDKDRHSKTRPLNRNLLWMVLLSMYVFLLSGIGYIAFWNQDFNDPGKLLGEYEELRGEYIETIKNAYSISDSTQFNDDLFINNDFYAILNQSMESSINSAGDLQELASQSFNIVLGAVLAFLSATATMMIQNNNKNNDT